MVFKKRDKLNKYLTRKEKVMSKHAFKLVLSFLLIGTVLVSFYLPGPATAEETKPKELKIGIVLDVIAEAEWAGALMQSFDRVIAEAPHGLAISYDYMENIYLPDAERIMLELAKSGKYDMIWVHSSYSEIIKKICGKYPEIIWVYSGSGNIPVGGNAYWIYGYIHEPAYLLGMLAGMMTKTDEIGVIGSYPYPSHNHPMNGYIEGAKSVNPDIKVKVAFIESWFDPMKAKEFSLAQISAGADFIFALLFGPFEACKDKGIFGFGNYIDQNFLMPDIVLSSAILLWDPAIKYTIEQWWEHKTEGVPYNAPMKKVVFLMKDGGADIAPYHGLADKVPQKVKDAVSKKRQEIMDGKFVVPFSEEKPTSD
jgi:basic membrane lipoprotein Med (substrate-binding protein (PBP1-ABC) superfamily)